MTTQEAAMRKALEALELYDHEDLTSCEARHALRTALAKQGEQQPVCAGCGIPEGDVHISTCQSGKWPLRVSNGDTATPAPQPLTDKEQIALNKRELFARMEAPVAWVWNPASIEWEKVRSFGHWQQGALYAFGPTQPGPIAAAAPQPVQGGSELLIELRKYANHITPASGAYSLMERLLAALQSQQPAQDQPSYRRDYPESQAVLGAEIEKAKDDERLYGVGFCVNGWHVPAVTVACWGMSKANREQSAQPVAAQPLTPQQRVDICDACASLDYDDNFLGDVGKIIDLVEAAHGIGAGNTI